MTQTPSDFFQSRRATSVAVVSVLSMKRCDIQYQVQQYFESLGTWISNNIYSVLLYDATATRTHTHTHGQQVFIEPTRGRYLILLFYDRALNFCFGNHCEYEYVRKCPARVDAGVAAGRLLKL